MAEPGELFEKKYRIGKLLGRGGMGVVHAATHIHLHKEVAIKRISAAGTGTKAHAARLLREGRTLALLDHPNIVGIHDCGITDAGEVYIVMDLLRGDTLAELIQRVVRKNKGADKGLEIADALTIVAQVADAIDNAHCAGIYHRDLKPENIIVGEGGDARVLDFGLAKDAQAPVEHAGKPSGPTDPRHVVGTPRFMSPEQVTGEMVDGRSDIYSMGVMLYQAISGRTPYDTYEDETTNDTELMAYHVFAKPRPIRDFVPECPERVCRILVRCLAKDPKERFQTARELAAELRAALEDLASVECSAAPQVGARPAPGPERTSDAAAREVRETEPMPEARVARPVLPFESPSPAPEPEPPAREIRNTEPMPEVFAPVQVLPFTAPRSREMRGRGHTVRMLPSAATIMGAHGRTPSAELAPRGKGHTVKMIPSAATLMAAGARAGAAADRAPPSHTAPKSLQRSRDVEEPRSVPISTTGFVVVDEATLPEARASRRSLSGASAGRSRDSRTSKIPPYFVAPIGGLLLALLFLTGLAAVRRSSGAGQTPLPAQPVASTDPTAVPTSPPNAAPPPAPPAPAAAGSTPPSTSAVPLVAPLASASPVVAASGQRLAPLRSGLPASRPASPPHPASRAGPTPKPVQEAPKARKQRSLPFGVDP